MFRVGRNTNWTKTSDCPKPLNFYKFHRNQFLANGNTKTFVDFEWKRSIINIDYISLRAVTVNIVPTCIFKFNYAYANVNNIAIEEERRHNVHVYSNSPDLLANCPLLSLRRIPCRFVPCINWYLLQIWLALKNDPMTVTTLFNLLMERLWFINEEKLDFNCVCDGDMAPIKHLALAYKPLVQHEDDWIPIQLQDRRIMQISNQYNWQAFLVQERSPTNIGHIHQDLMGLKPIAHNLVNPLPNWTGYLLGRNYGPPPLEGRQRIASLNGHAVCITNALTNFYEMFYTRQWGPPNLVFVNHKAVVFKEDHIYGMRWHLNPVELWHRGPMPITWSDPQSYAHNKPTNEELLSMPRQATKDIEFMNAMANYYAGTYDDYPNQRLGHDNLSATESTLDWSSDDTTE